MTRYTFPVLLLLASAAWAQDTNNAEAEHADHDAMKDCTPTEQLEQRIDDLDAKIDETLGTKADQVDALIEALNRKADDAEAAEEDGEHDAEAAEEDQAAAEDTDTDYEWVGPLLPIEPDDVANIEID